MSPRIGLVIIGTDDAHVTHCRFAPKVDRVLLRDTKNITEVFEPIAIEV